MESVWTKDGKDRSTTRPAAVPARTAIELLKAHHAYADNFRNYVATDETYYSADHDDGETMISGPYRRWYWDSDLRRQTIAALREAGEI